MWSNYLFPYYHSIFIVTLFIALGGFHYETDEKVKATKKETCLNDTLPFYMKKLEAVAKSNNGFLANGKVSVNH